MKKCRTCGEGEMTTNREVYRYGDCGLDVVLVDIDVRRCPNCGAHEALIPAVATLHRVIAQAVIAKPTRLSGPEIRFLRKYIGLSGADFAEHMGVGASIVSNWENDKDPIGPISDRLLRMLVAHGAQVQDYSIETLKTISDDREPPQKMRLRQKSRNWALEAH